MGKSAPKPPDYAGAAREQAQSSREVTEQQTWANRPDQFTPFGSTTWENTPTRDPATGQILNRWTQNTQLSPQSQAALDAQLALQRDRSQLGQSLTGRMQSEYGSAMDWGNLPSMGQAVAAPGQVYGGRIQSDIIAPTYDPSGMTRYGAGPIQGQYSPEDIQRGLSTEGLQDIDPSQRYYQQANDAIYGQWADRALPEQSRQTNALRTQLYNQGLTEGSEAYDNEMRRLRESQGDQQRQAQYQATIGAGQEASRMFGMDSQARGQMFGERSQQGMFGNQAAQQALQQQLGIGGQRFQESLAGGQYSDAQRQQQMQEMLGFGQTGFQNQLAGMGFSNDAQQQAFQQAMAGGEQNFNQQMDASQYQNQLRQQQIVENMQQRGFSLNEINALLYGQQVGMPAMPNFSNASRAEGLQALQAAQLTGQSELDRFNAQQMGTQGLLSGAAGMFQFSDRRLKTDIVQVGIGFHGYPIYQYRYIWEPKHVQHYGVMSDEVDPALVKKHESGYDMVNYGAIYE